MHKVALSMKDELPANVLKNYIPLDGDIATIRNFGQISTNCSRNDISAVEA